jgi:hypothetical protein
MSARRTNGMLLLGVLHIVLGALGALLSSALLLVGVALRLPSVITIDHPLLAGARGAASGLIALAALRAISSVTLIVAGIRVLDVAPAGRTLSLGAAFTWTFINVIEAFAFSEPLWLFLLATVYPLVTEWLFLRKDWRVAFSRDAGGGEGGRVAIG